MGGWGGSIGVWGRISPAATVCINALSGSELVAILGELLGLVGVVFVPSQDRGCALWRDHSVVSLREHANRVSHRDAKRAPAPALAHALRAMCLVARARAHTHTHSALFLSSQHLIINIEFLFFPSFHFLNHQVLLVIF